MTIYTQFNNKRFMVTHVVFFPFIPLLLITCWEEIQLHKGLDIFNGHIM